MNIYTTAPQFREYEFTLVPAEDPRDLRWQDDALCRQVDPEIFFVEKGGSTRPAKSVCRNCTVRAECLEYALGNDERFGVYGGMSERERRRLKRQPAASTTQPQGKAA